MSLTSRLCAATMAMAGLGIVSAAPTSSCITDASCGPIPGESDLYEAYSGIAAPWPTNITGATLNTTVGPPEGDDLLWQGLLSAEWIVFSFYQQGVEAFNESAFVSAGFPAMTYQRIMEIRDNEAGHIRIMQDQIGSNTVKPGHCEYDYGFTDPYTYLVIQQTIEIGSMAFLTGLEMEATTNLTKGALNAIASTESRHNTWALIENWDASPFAGPVDTVYPYPHQVYQVLTYFVVNGTCPKENPIWPNPALHLTQLTLSNTTTSVAPGSPIQFETYGPPLHFDDSKEYYAVFFHGIVNATMPLNTTDLTTQVPSNLEPLGIYEIVIATEAGAPTPESVVAGPYLMTKTPNRKNPRSSS